MLSAVSRQKLARLLTRHHGEVTLSKAKWDTICGKPERYYYRFNGDKVATTLIAPDLVRHHASIGTQFLYYKRDSRNGSCWPLALRGRR